jgi:hypothetical protein
MRTNKVVFFFPAFSSQEATALLGILVVLTLLLRAGYQVRIIDSTITPNFQKRVVEEFKDALSLAVSLVTGTDDPGNGANCSYRQAPLPGQIYRIGRLASFPLAAPDNRGRICRHRCKRAGEEAFHGSWKQSTRRPTNKRTQTFVLRSTSSSGFGVEAAPSDANRSSWS